MDTGKTRNRSNKPDNAFVTQIKYTYIDLQRKLALIVEGFDYWSQWERFFQRYEKEELLYSEIGVMMKDVPLGKGEDCKLIPPLSKNWLICLRNLMEKEMQKMVLYLLSEDRGLEKPVPSYPR